MNRTFVPGTLVKVVFDRSTHLNGSVGRVVIADPNPSLDDVCIKLDSGPRLGQEQFFAPYELKAIEDEEEFQGAVMAWGDDHWDCEQCEAKNQKVVSRHVAGRADPTEVLTLECGHILF